MGAGAVGCYFGGMLARAGVPVTLIGRGPHVDAINRDGLLFDGIRVHERIHARASAEIDAVRDAGLVLFCVKTTDTESAARALRPHLRGDALLVSMQNGVDNVERIHAAAGIGAVAAVVYVAAAMTAPGHVTHSGRGDLVLGLAPESPAEADLHAIAAMFERAEVPCRVSLEIRAELWGKMLLNCGCNAISALGRAGYGHIARHQEARDLVCRTIEEAVAVARTEGVTLSADAMAEAAFTLGSSVGSATSSTAQDIARGKPTEIDSLNGYVVRRAAQHGIPVPVNQTLYTLVKLLEDRAAV